MIIALLDSVVLIVIIIIVVLHVRKVLHIRVCCWDILGSFIVLHRGESRFNRNKIAMYEFEYTYIIQGHIFILFDHVYVTLTLWATVYMLNKNMSTSVGQVNRFSSVEDKVKNVRNQQGSVSRAHASATYLPSAAVASQHLEPRFNAH